MRSLIPDKARVMSLTATATHSLMLELIDIIGMIDPITVVLPPCKPNIIYKILFGFWIMFLFLIILTVGLI